MKEYWQSTFNIDPTKPSMGAVDLAGVKSQSFNDSYFMKNMNYQAEIWWA